MAFDVGSVVAHIKADITDFTKGLASAEKQASLFGSHIQGVADNVQRGLAVAGAAAAAAVIVAGKKAIDYATEYEQQKIALVTLLGDEAKAEDHITKIRKDALKTPFNVSELVRYNQLLISAGVSAENSEKDILNMGDALSANGKGAAELDRVIVNLQQIKNVGSATEMDMRQFAFNGINMYQLLAESTKLPIEKLKDMDITYEMISGALAKAAGEGGKYHDANLRQSASLAGLKSNLEDTVQQQLINIANTTGMYDAAKLLILQLTQFVTDTGPSVATALTSVGDIIKTVTSFLIDHRTEVQILTGFITAFFLPALISVSVQMGINLYNAVANATLNIIKFGIEGWNAVYMLMAKIIQLGIATAAFIAHTVVTVAQTVAQIALTAATWAFNAAMAVLTSPIFLVIAAIAALIAIGYYLITHWEDVKQAASRLWQFVVDGWNGLVSRIRSVAGSLLDAIMWPFEEAKKRIQDAVNWIKDRLDFTQRHSPSVVDIVENGVNKVNEALGGLGLDGSFGSIAGPAMSYAGNQNSNVIVKIDMSGAIISDTDGARKMAEDMGDAIIRKLQFNVRV